MKNIFFFQTQQIPDSSSIFDQLRRRIRFGKNQQIFFSYFQVDQKYYLFFYSQKSIQIDFLYQSVNVIQELDSKQLKIRSLRGFFLYALEIVENGKDYEILSTNLQPFFWRKVKNIIRQNKKGALPEFLFGSQESIPSTRNDRTQVTALEIQNHFQDKIESLENQANSLAQQVQRLQHKLINLEAKFIEVLRNSKYPLPKQSAIFSEPSQPLETALCFGESTKTIQQHNSLRETSPSVSGQVRKATYSTQNQSKVNLEVKKTRHPISESLSNAPKISFKPLSNIQQKFVIESREKPSRPPFHHFGESFIE